MTQPKLSCSPHRPHRPSCKTRFFFGIGKMATDSDDDSIDREMMALAEEAEGGGQEAATQEQASTQEAAPEPQPAKTVRAKILITQKLDVIHHANKVCFGPNKTMSIKAFCCQ